MARSRNIKPGFFLNVELSELHLSARILFIGLWCIADREGRLEDIPKKIKAQVFPYDNFNVDKLLNDLQKYNFIIRYTVDNQKYIQVVNFAKHQNPHIKEAPSVIPAFKEQAPDKNHTNTILELEQNHTSHADSLNLILDSFNPITLNPEPDTLKLFDVFWSKYPKKKSKGQAETAWKKIKITDDLFKKIVESVELAKETPEWTKDNGQYIPYPATWLNAKGWEDEITRKEAPTIEYPDDW